MLQMVFGIYTQYLFNLHCYMFWDYAVSSSFASNVFCIFSMMNTKNTEIEESYQLKCRLRFESLLFFAFHHSDLIVTWKKSLDCFTFYAPKQSRVTLHERNPKYLKSGPLLKIQFFWQNLVKMSFLGKMIDIEQRDFSKKFQKR